MFQKLQRLQKALRNILLCNVYRLSGNLDYPNYILPKTNYKPLMNVDGLVKSQPTCLVRRSDKSLEDTFNKLGDYYTLKEGVIIHSDIPNLSLNLLGGLFEVQHIKYKTNHADLSSKRWDGTSPIYLADYVNSYIKVENYCAVYIDANNVHDVNVPYKRPVDKELTNLLKAFNKDRGFEEEELKKVKNDYVLEGKTEVAHDPTNLNYWHVEFKISDYKGDTVHKGKPNWIKAYCKQVLNDLISANAYPVAPSSENIPSSFYHK